MKGKQQEYNDLLEKSIKTRECTANVHRTDGHESKYRVDSMVSADH